MKTIRTVLLVLMTLVVTMEFPSASGNVGIYGVIEKVVFEPSEAAPERVQVWGAFAHANGGIGNDTAWSPVARGYLYFRLPAAAVASDGERELIQREWLDLKAVAGTTQAVGFGRWGYIGRFEGLQKEGQPYFLERAPKGGEYTDLRVRPATVPPSAPAAYQTNSGIVKLPAVGSHAELVTNLRAAVGR